MITSYVPVLLLLILAIAFPLGLMIVTSFLGPRVKNQAKAEAYECGVPPVGDIHAKFPVKFYRIAILFLIFDIEAALLWPWAVLFKKQIATWGVPFLLWELALFLLVLAVGYIYALKKGALEWD